MRAQSGAGDAVAQTTARSRALWSSHLTGAPGILFFIISTGLYPRSGSQASLCGGSRGSEASRERTQRREQSNYCKGGGGGGGRKRLIRQLWPSHGSGARNLPAPQLVRCRMGRCCLLPLPSHCLQRCQRTRGPRTAAVRARCHGHGSAMCRCAT